MERGTAPRDNASLPTFAGGLRSDFEGDAKKGRSKERGGI